MFFNRFSQTIVGLTKRIFSLGMNQTFVDSSSGVTFTTVGSPTFDTTVKIAGTASLDLNGTSNIFAAQSTNYNIGVSDFTMEAWVYNTGSRTSGNNYPCILENRTSSTSWSSGEWALQMDHVSSPGKLSFACHNYSPTGAFLVGTTNTVLNTWYHVAVTRNGNVFRLFVNGVPEVNVDTAVSLDNGPAEYLVIGSGSNIGTYFKGKIDEVQINIGEAKYISNFIVPNPYDVLLLQCNDAPGSTTLIDDTLGIRSGKTATLIGNAAISSAQSKNGGYSVVMDGTGDWISVAHTADLNFGSSNFTMECWVYPLNLTARMSSSAHGLMGKRANADTTYAGVSAWITNTGKIAVTITTNGTSWAVAANSVNGTVVANKWNHVAIVRSGSNVNVFVNGSMTTISTSLTGAIVNDSTNMVFGAVGNAGVSWNIPLIGYIDEIRVTNGFARYAANFVPTAPYYSNTNSGTIGTPSALLDFANNASWPGNGSTWYDISGNGKNATNNAYVTTSSDGFQYQGTTAPAYTSFGAGTGLNQYSGDFTIAVWCMRQAGGVAQGNIIGDYYTNSSAVTNDWQILLSSSMAITVYRTGTGSMINTGSVGTVGQWIHVVLRRRSGTVNLYVNNILQASVANNAVWGYAGGNLGLGADGNGSSEYLTGKIGYVSIHNNYGYTNSDISTQFNALRGRFGI